MLTSPVWRFAADRVGNPAVSVDRALAKLPAARTDALAAEALNEACIALDEDLDRTSRGTPALSRAHVEWGPFPAFTPARPDELRLIAWPEGPHAVVKQNPLDAMLRHHRLLVGQPTGITWDLAQLGAEQSSTQRAILDSLLDSEDIRLGAWSGQVGVSITTNESGCATVGPSAAQDADELLRDVLEGIAWARDSGVAILVLPELYVPSTRVHEVQAELRDTSGALPVLTLVGLTHQSGAPGRWRNEAVLLDWQGRQLASYDKVRPFNTRGVAQQCSGCCELGWWPGVGHVGW